MAADNATDRGRETRDLLVVGLIAALIIVWGGIVFFLIGDKPEDWDYGSQPYIPGESYQSTEMPRRPADAPPQVQLPASEEPAR